MDIISHAIWGATIIRKEPMIWWAAFFGALPDLCSIIPFFVHLKTNKFRRYNNQEFWKYVESSSFYTKLYYVFHSLVTAILLTFFVYIIFPQYWFVTVPYFLHIFLDIFSHKDKWATRILYPISDIHFNGINWWRSKWLNMANWFSLIIVNVGIWLIKK